jgi:acyl-CoA thioesterase FadM
MSWMILFKKQLFDLKVKVPWRSLRYATHHLLFMHPHTNYHLPISKDKNVMARTRKYYSKNNYLTLRSKVKVQRMSLRYATHLLMVMHPHTIYHWPISKDKKVMVRTSFAEKKRKKKKKRKRKKKIRLKQYVSLRSMGRHNNTWVQENVNKH